MTLRAAPDRAALVICARPQKNEARKHASGLIRSVAGKIRQNKTVERTLEPGAAGAYSL
jgi:hypothetical protein